MTTKKKLIEVALPLEAINVASAREKSIRHGHPSTLHLWWARRPLAAARAVIFAQMVDDPSGHSDLFPTEEAQETERQRLFRIIEDLVKWENITNERVLEQARDEIRKSWRRTCAENSDHPQAKELFDPEKLPAFHDPFAGGGSLPLEAQRLGLEAYASDLNPVAVLINKAMIEIPPKFAGRPPVNPEARAKAELATRRWMGAEGLAEDVRYYGKWMRNEAEKRIGHLYPRVQITELMVAERPDLKQYLGQELTVIAWIWARTVKSPNPAFSTIDIPLASTFMLSMKEGKEAYVLPVVENKGYRLTIGFGTPENVEQAKSGTKFSRGSFKCLLSGSPISGDYIKSEGRAGRIGARMLAIVAEGQRERIYLSPTPEMEELAFQASPPWRPEFEFFQQALGFRIGNYGMTKWSDLFTSRQTLALVTLCDLVEGVSRHISEHIRGVGDSISAESEAYCKAICVYLSLGIGRSADFWSSIATWSPQPKNELVSHTFTKQAIPITWDFAEANPFSDSGGNFIQNLSFVSKCLDNFGFGKPGFATQLDAGSQPMSLNKIVSTDPPYYDNVGYADLSDFFYVWLRRALRPLIPELFSTVVVPKAEELVVTPARHAHKAVGETYFIEGMTNAMRRLAEQAHSSFPVTIYYAFKQAESDGSEGISSTGWETFLAAIIRAGFTISGTWPIRTERMGRGRSIGSNALASSIVLVCRRRSFEAPAAMRRDFIAALKAELPQALAHLQHTNIAPVDLAQSAIGPGMAVYTRYERVLDSAGNSLSVREALALINETLDEVLAEQEGDFDSDSRWALTWFDQMGFAEGEYGDAETLSKAKNTSVEGLEKAGILKSSRSKVRLLRPEELPADWDPTMDPRLTAWEIVHQLVRLLEKSGESGAAEIVAKLGSKAEIARELCYRLYTICERKKRAVEALAYNGLVKSWPEINRLAREFAKPAAEQIELF